LMINSTWNSDGSVAGTPSPVGVSQSFIDPNGKIFRKRASTVQTIRLLLARPALSILLAGCLVAIAILIAFRWQITAAPGFVYRLDRWSGHVNACELSNLNLADCPFLR
jgi:hypothetical protein